MLIIFQWPYSYDACDVGTAPNQTINGLPAVATTSGLEDSEFELSYLPGQRLSQCTCPGESHPGPMHSDGTFVGRSAPEIDIFEGQVFLIANIHASNIDELFDLDHWRSLVGPGFPVWSVGSTL